MIHPIRSADSQLALLLDGLEEAFHKKSWHGPNLRNALRGVTAKEAAWRPGKERHNIWELALHAAYWKYVVRRKLAGDKRGLFVLKGSNFFPRPEVSSAPSETAWRNDIAILETEHRIRFGPAGQRLIPPVRPMRYNGCGQAGEGFMPATVWKGQLYLFTARDRRITAAGRRGPADKRRCL